MDTVSADRTWDESVLDRLTDHIAAEREVLAEYQKAAELVEAPDVRYLMRLILDDERRHHRIFEEMARAVQGAREWRQLEPKVPGLSAQPLPDDVRGLTEHLLAAEREDARQLKALRRQLKPVADTTLWALLIDLMALDTEKHERILEFITDHAGG